jgi:hypothetical protein
MSRRTVLIPTIQGNGAAGQKTVNIPGGLDIIATLRQGVTCVAANMTQFQTLVNSAAFRTVTGTQQDAMNQADLLAAMSVDNALRVPYEIPRMKSIAQQYGTTLNFQAPDPVTGSYINTVQETWTDTTTDTWSMWAEVDDNSPNAGTGGVERIANWTLNLTANATFSSSIAPYIQGTTGQPTNRWLHALYILAAAGTLANGETRILRGTQGEVMFDRLAVMNYRILTDYGIRGIPAAYATASGGLIIDTTETGISEMIDTMMVAPKGTLSSAAGAVTRSGQLIIPYSNFDIRLSPTNTTTGGVLVRSMGYLS